MDRMIGRGGEREVDGARRGVWEGKRDIERGRERYRGEAGERGR